MEIWRFATCGHGLQRSSVIKMQSVSEESEQDSVVAVHVHDSDMIVVQTSRRYGIAEDASRIASSIVSRNLSPNPKQAKKDDAKLAPAAKDKKAAVVSIPRLAVQRGCCGNATVCHHSATLAVFQE